MNDQTLPAPRNKQTRGQGRTTNFPRLLGERLCLHFANTIEGPLSEHPIDFLTTYDDLVTWTWHAGIIEHPETDRLTAAAQSQPAAATAVFARALALRAAIRTLFRAIARLETPRDDDLARLHAEYTAALTAARLTARGSGYAWSWDHRPDDLSRPLWLIAESAVALLIEGDPSRIKECPGAGDCGWLFYDTSKNGARRWCSMEGCGSRVKMRRHYARRHTPAEA